MADLPPDLGTAIVEKFKASSALVDGFTGGIERALADKEPTGPSLVFSILSARTNYVTASSRWQEIKVRFACFARSGGVAEALRRLVIAEFEGARTAHDGKVSVPWEVANVFEEKFPKPAHANLTNRYVVDFSVKE